MINIYVDGACSGNPGIGAWAVVIEGDTPEKVQWMTGKMVETTNNEVELEALIRAILFVFERIPKEEEITIYSDSMYVVKGITGEWKVKTHLESWAVAEEYNHPRIQYKWVKGHAGNKMNELADQLAKAAIKTYIPDVVHMKFLDVELE
jgi:ribonuclease HI